MSQRSEDDAPLPGPALESGETPVGIDRRAFMMRSAMIGAVAVLAGAPPANAKDTAARAASAASPKSNLSPDLDVVKRAKGPVMTTLEEFYKVGPGPSSSHTIGPMRITYDFSAAQAPAA
jgi:L-serine dehydratase